MRRARHLTRLVVALALGAALVLGCAQDEPPPDAEWVIVNRSAVAVAIWPEVIIGPCGVGAYTGAQLDRGLNLWKVAWEARDASWIPEGAVQYNNGIALAPRDKPKPMTVVISGINQPEVFFGPLPPDVMPPCGGDPLGIN